MAKAKHRDTIKVHYTSILEDGTVFGSIINDEPLQFKVGKGQVIPGFEKAIVGIKECPKKQKDCANCEILDCPEEEV